MRIRVSILALLVLPGLPYDRASGQTISLQGTVVIQNSEYETGKKLFVSDASIRAPFAKAVVSDMDGRFVLSFAGAEQGTSVRLMVSKGGLVVVNHLDVEQVILGRSSQLRVVMADADRLAEAQARYHRIAIDAIARNYERNMAVLRDEKKALDREFEQHGLDRSRQLDTLSNAIDQLTRQWEIAMEHAGELASRFSTTNLDDASDLYLKAFSVFQRGDLDSALILLDQKTLDHSYLEALDHKAKGAMRVAAADLTFHQLADSYRLKADVLQATLRFDGSLKVLRTLLGIMIEQADTFDALDRIVALTEVGRMEQRTGDFDRSLQDLDSALIDARVQLPFGHPQVSAIQRLRSNVLLDKGDHDAAFQAANEALDIARESLGKDHVDVGYGYAELAQVLIEQGEYEQALQNYAQANTICTNVLGPEAPYIGSLLSAIGIAYLDLGDLDSALTYCVRGSEILKEHSLPGDPMLAIALSDLAVVFSERGGSQEAIDAMRSARSILVDALGEDHPDIGKIDVNIGTEMKKAGYPDSAMVYYDRSLRIITRAMGGEHALVGMVYSLIASAYVDMEDRQAALATSRTARAITMKALGPEHTEVAMIDNSMGTMFFGLGEKDSALFYYDEGERIFAANGMADHYNVALIRDNKALLLSSIGAFEEALEEARSALLIYLAALGAEHPYTMSSNETVGSILLELDQLDSARTYLLRAFSGPVNEPLTSIHLIEVVRDLATLYTRSGQLDSARSFADTALVRSIRGYGPRSRYAAIAHGVLADVFTGSGNYDDALEHYGISMAIMDSVWGPVDRRVAQDEADIGKVHYLKGDRTAATEVLSSSYARVPNATASWYLYRISSDQGDDDAALEWLVRCANIRLKRGGARRSEREETTDALRREAARSDRPDILEQFGLD